MSTKDESLRVTEVVTATSSLSPPAPLSLGPACSRARNEPQKTLVCAAAPPAPPLVSYPPATSALACYTGTTLDGRYKVDTILGEGGMGIVYLARHKFIDKRVAVKVLRADFARQKEITARFLQEAKAASSIGNPHIVDISDFGELPDGSTYLVMEWLDGFPLTKLVRERKPVPTKKIVEIALQIADGLFAAHERRIVHRDLKPDNIFLAKHGNETEFVKILDFGIAKVTNDAGTKMTRAGMLFGTPHYMSPEQANGAEVDHRTDIYALGVILYELASGRVPFDADTMMGILTQHMFKTPTPIHALADSSGIEPGLEAIIMKSLSKEPEQRYATMKELSLDLEKLGRGESPLALSEMMVRAASMFPPELLAKKVAPAAPPLVPLRTPRTPWGVYAGITAILVACGLVLGVFLQASSSKAQVSTGVLSPPPPSAPVASTQALRVEPARTSMQVLFAAEPLDARVFQGETDLGHPPITIDVPTGGEVVLEVRRAGYRTRAITLDGTEKKCRSNWCLNAAPPCKLLALWPPRSPRPKGGKAKSSTPGQVSTKHYAIASVDDIERIESCREARFRSYGECAAVIGSQRIDLAHVFSAEVHAGVPLELEQHRAVRATKVRLA